MPNDNVTPELKMPVVTADDVNDLFNSLDDKGDDKHKEDDAITDDDEDEKPKKDKSEKKDKKSKDDDAEDDDSDDDLELVESDDDEVEKIDLKAEDDIEVDAPPRKKDILKEFPEVFKKFPFLEKMMYRDKQMMELFGSFDDAKELSEKAEIYNNFDKQLMSGKTEEILKNVKTADPKAFDKIVDDYLPALHRVDRDAYFEVIGNIGKRLILDMAKKGKELDNDKLKEAALIINQFLFDSNDFQPIKPRTDAKASEEKSEVEEERLAYVQERFEASRDDLQSKVTNTLKATITEYIDPKDIMSSYVKKNAVADAHRLVEDAIRRDPTFQKTLDKLWRNAFDAKFSKDSLGRIKSFYLSRAKGNLKSSIMEARAEALKDLQPRTKREKDDVVDKDDEKPQRRPSTGRPSSKKEENGMKKGESVSDFFARE